MPPAKRTLRGVEVTVKYDACPRKWLEIVFGEIVYNFFYALLVGAFKLCCLYINLRYVWKRHYLYKKKIVHLFYVKRKLRLTVLHIFLTLVRVWEDFSYGASCSPPYLCPFLDSNLEEAEGLEEPEHWEAPLEGIVHPEAHQVKELI